MQSWGLSVNDELLSDSAEGARCGDPLGIRNGNPHRELHGLKRGCEYLFRTILIKKLFLQAKDIAHAIDAWLFADDPLGCPESAACKHRPVVCTMGELDSLKVL